MPDRETTQAAPTGTDGEAVGRSAAAPDGPRGAEPSADEAPAADWHTAEAPADEPLPADPLVEDSPADEPLPAGETASEPVPPAEPDDFRDRYLRSAAELDNVRKRARRDVALAEGRGIARLARELLPALDNFERALAAAESVPENADHHLTDGIRLVQSELLGALARVGIEPDSPKGEAFDPHRHEAVAQQPVPGTEPGTIVEVFQSGYRHGEALLRPAKVVVAA